MSFFVRALTRQTLQNIDQVQCVNENDKFTLHKLGVSQVEVAGDTRYDQVVTRLSHERSAEAREAVERLRPHLEPRALIAGSVWKEDIEPVVKASIATQTRVRHTLILVPHEISPTFIEEIQTRCAAEGVAKDRIARFSELRHSQAEAKFDVVIVDAVGYLAELYLLGEIAFVGGSFRKTVHSVMEPLAAGCLTVVGPWHRNNREAIEFQALKLDATSAHFVTCVCDADDFTEKLQHLWNESAARDFKARIRGEVERRGGATANVLRWLRSNSTYCL